MATRAVGRIRQGALSISGTKWLRTNRERLVDCRAL